MNRFMLHFEGWSGIIRYNKTVPTWKSSQQGLWIILSNRFRICGTRLAVEMYIFGASGRCIVHELSCKITKIRQLTKYNLDGWMTLQVRGKWCVLVLGWSGLFGNVKHNSSNNLHQGLIVLLSLCSSSRPVTDGEICMFTTVKIMTSRQSRCLQLLFFLPFVTKMFATVLQLWAPEINFSSFQG